MSLGRRWSSPGGAFLRWSIGPAPWIVAVTIVVVVQLGADRARLVELLGDGLPASAVASTGEDGDVHVAYDHELVGPVVSPLRLGGAVAGERVGVRYDADDPYSVVPADAEPPTDRRSLVVAVATIVALATLVALQWSARRWRRLARAESVTFRMIGVVHRSRWSTVPKLSFYAVDADVAEPPVCTVRLADRHVPLRADVCHEVDVKGLPRHGGRVVAAHDGTVLWPRGGALLSARHPRPDARAPASVDDLAPAQQRGADPFWIPLRADRPTGRFGPLQWVAVAGGIGVVLTALVAVVVSVNASETARWTAAGHRTVATIADRPDTDFAVAVAVDVDVAGDADVPGVDAPAEMLAPVDVPDEWETGRRYPAVVSDDGTRVRLLAEPYDRVEPILWFAIPTAVLLWHLARRLLGG